MSTTPYVPVSFTSEQITQQKLQQMANNDQWLFENSARLRYTSGSGVVRDSQVKIISGKTPYSVAGDGELVYIYFGSFFTVGCKPIVNLTPSWSGSKGRVSAAVGSLNYGNNSSAEVDHTGFVASVWINEIPSLSNNIVTGGWLYWTAVGY